MSIQISIFHKTPYPWYETYFISSTSKWMQNRRKMPEGDYRTRKNGYNVKDLHSFQTTRTSDRNRKITLLSLYPTCNLRAPYRHTFMCLNTNYEKQKSPINTSFLVFMGLLNFVKNYALDKYSPVLVSILILSFWLTNNGT